nr:hypothetical protein [Tanacetum cinerariifolium]
MVAVLEKTEHNTDFHQIVDFLEASHIRTVPLFASMIITQGEGLANPTQPHHIPSPQEHQSPQSNYSPQHDSPPLSHQTIIPKPIPHDLQAPTEILTARRLTRRAIRIAQSKALSPDADEPASLSRDDRHGEAFPTVSSLDAGQDKENIAKTFAMSHESSPRVPSLDADEGSIQQRIHELMELCTSLQRQQSQMANKIKDQDIKISRLKARVKSLDGGTTFSTASVSPVDVFPTAGVPTVSGSFPNVSVIFTTASVATPYTRRSKGITTGSLRPMRIPIISAKEKGKEKVTETEVPKKKKLQEQIDAQVAREIEEEFVRENQRLSEQATRDSEIARIHAEEELKLMIEGLDRSNEVIAKHLNEYEQAEANLSIGEKIELISELVKYQDHLAEILKYQAQQSKPLSKRSKGVWKHMQDFVPMLSKKESEKVKRPGIKLDQGSSKRVKISHTSRSKPSQEQQFKGSKGVSEEELKGMMQLVPLEEVYIEALQVKHPIIDWEIHTEENGEYWKIIRLGDSKDQLWTYHQAFMHDPLDWKLYDSCGVHHVSTKNKEIFMLVEKDYPLTKGLATVMIVQDEELFEASSPGEHLIQET